MLASLAVLDSVEDSVLDSLEAFEDSDRKSTRLNSSHQVHLVCRLLLEKKKKQCVLSFS